MNVYACGVSQRSRLVLVLAEDERSACKAAWDSGFTLFTCSQVETTITDYDYGEILDAEEVASRVPEHILRERKRVEARRLSKQNAQERYRRLKQAAREQQLATKALHARTVAIVPDPAFQRYQKDQFIQRTPEKVRPIGDPVKLPVPVSSMPSVTGDSHLLKAEVDRREHAMLRRYSCWSKGKSRRYEGWAS